MKKILLMGLVCSVGYAQTLDINALRTAQARYKAGSVTSTGATQVSQAESKVLIDQPINPEKYLVGPGDQFRVNIISSNETFDYSLIVSPSGEILIPAVGILPVYGLTLTQAIGSMKEMVKARNQSVKIYVTLEEIRQFRVKVIGHFNQTGFYEVTAMTHVSDLYNQIKEQMIYKENDDKSFSPKSDIMDPIPNESKSQIDDLYERKIRHPENENEPYEISSRNIVLIRGQDSLNIDLAWFGITGDNQFNPYLNQGDILLVPYQTHSINIYGGVKKPGEYEYVAGKSLHDLVQIAGGLRPGAESVQVEITRYDSPTEKQSFNVNIRDEKTIQLKPEDHVMVKYDEQYKHQDIVHITGAITYPGVYSIERGESTVGEIIQRAGNYTSRADSTKISINNRSIYEIPDRELERILLIPDNDINRSDEEKAYVKARIRTQKGALETNWQSQTHTVKEFPVVDGDVIHILENFEYVELVGAVKNPGRYPYVKSLSLNDYLKITGGLTSNASRKIFIIKAGTGQRIPANNQTKIDTGDTIFVAEKKEYNKWTAAKDILTATGQLATLFIVVQRILDN